MNQTFTDWECVIIDDGSTDNSREIALHYCTIDQRFKYHYQENMGLSKARNAGIIKSSGQYVHFLDSDDLILSYMYTEVINIFESFPEINIVYGDFSFIDKMNMEVINSFKPVDKISNYLIEFFLHNIFPVHAAVINKDFLKKVGYFDEELKSVEDWDLWIRCAISGANFFHYNKVVCSYRIYPESMSSNLNRMLEQSEKVLKKRFESVKESDYIYKNVYKVEQLSYLSLYLTIYLKSVQSNNEIIKKICIKKIKKILKYKIAISRYRYFILGKYIDIAEASKPIYFFGLSPLIYARKIKRWFKREVGPLE